MKITRNQDIKLFSIFEQAHVNPRFHSPINVWKRSLRMRPHYVTTAFSFAIPTMDALNKIKQFSPIIEMGAGTGYWAYLLKEVGTEIVAYDNFSRKDMQHGYWFPVALGSHEKVKEHPNHTLLLVWPPYEDDFACNCLNSYKGEIVLYVGECAGGCTANDKFFDVLTKAFEEPEYVEIPRWCGMFDFMGIYRRKK